MFLLISLRLRLVHPTTQQMSCLLSCPDVLSEFYHQSKDFTLLIFYPLQFPCRWPIQNDLDLSPKIFSFILLTLSLFETLQGFPLYRYRKGTSECNIYIIKKWKLIGALAGLRKWLILGSNGSINIAIWIRNYQVR